MRFPWQFFYDLYGKNIKYTMTFFMLIVVMNLAYLFYLALTHEDFLRSEIKEVKIEYKFNNRGMIYFNGKYTIMGMTNKDTISMHDVLIPGSILLKTSKNDSVVVLDAAGKAHSFILNDDDIW